MLLPDLVASPYSELVSRLLAGILPGVRLEDIAVGPPEHLTLRLTVGGRDEKRVLVAEELVRLAQRGVPAAIAGLRGALETQLGRSTVGTPVATSSRYRALATGQVRCAVCQQPFRLQDYVVVRRAQVVHSHCDAPPPRAG